MVLWCFITFLGLGFTTSMVTAMTDEQLNMRSAIRAMMPTWCFCRKDDDDDDDDASFRAASSEQSMKTQLATPARGGASRKQPTKLAADRPATAPMVHGPSSDMPDTAPPCPAPGALSHGGSCSSGHVHFGEPPGTAPKAARAPPPALNLKATAFNANDPLAA